MDADPVSDTETATVLITKEFWLHVTAIAVAGGMILTVYRAINLRETSRKYLPVLAIIGEALPFYREIVEDEMMYGGKAVLSKYSLPSLPPGCMEAA